MIRFLLWLALLLLAVGGLQAAPPKVPKQVTVPVGEDYTLTIEVESDDSFGMAPGFLPGDCTFFEGALRGGRKQFLVRPKKDGPFVVTFWTKGETAFSQTVINTTEVPDDGGVDDPDGKKPPKPPSDPLFAVLQEAFKADGGPKNAKKQPLTKDLAAVYRLGANKVVDDQTLPLRVDLITMMHQTAENTVGKDGLKAVRTALQAELNKVVGGNEKDSLTKEIRDRYKAQFARVATLLEAVK